MKLGYMRVSTDKQDNALQYDALCAAGCDQVYEDCISGKSTTRPGFDLLLSHVAPGDQIVVWKLDRLGRSLVHVVQTVNEFKRRGIHFSSLTETIDTTTPMGSFTFHIMAALAQLEREIISERTKAGLAATKARGTRLGRPNLSDDADTMEVKRLRADGHSIRRIEELTGINRGRVERICKSGVLAQFI